MSICEVLGNILLSVLIPGSLPMAIFTFPTPLTSRAVLAIQNLRCVCDLEKRKPKQDATCDGVIPWFSICRPQPPAWAVSYFQEGS